MSGKVLKKRVWVGSLVFYALALVTLLIYSAWRPGGAPDWTQGAGGVSEEDRSALQAFVEAASREGLKGLDQEVKRFATRTADGDLSADLRLYFVQERFDGRSSDHEFFARELQPAQETFRKSLEYGSHVEMREAFARLRSRVMNYELGAGAQEERLGEGAQAYLASYRSVMDRGTESAEDSE